MAEASAETEGRLGDPGSASVGASEARPRHVQSLPSIATSEAAISCGAVRALIALPAETPSLCLLADNMAEALAGISHALNGLALLVGDPTRPLPRRGGLRLRVPDWLPALVNAGRTFVTIGAAELFWRRCQLNSVESTFLAPLS